MADTHEASIQNAYQRIAQIAEQESSNPFQREQHLVLAYAMRLLDQCNSAAQAEQHADRIAHIRSIVHSMQQLSDPQLFVLFLHDALMPELYALIAHFPLVETPQFPLLSSSHATVPTRNT